MQANINELVNAIVGANGSIAVAVERLNRRHMNDADSAQPYTDAETLIEQLAAEPAAQELIAKQFRVKATLTTYSMLMAYQAELLSVLGDEDRPLSQQGAVQGFSAIANLFNSLTENRGVATNINVFDKVLSVLSPEARDALTTLAVSEPLPPAPTPIRKRGRPNSLHLAGPSDNDTDTNPTDPYDPLEALT